MKTLTLNEFFHHFEGHVLLRQYHAQPLDWGKPVVIRGADGDYGYVLEGYIMSTRKRISMVYQRLKVSERRTV